MTNEEDSQRSPTLLSVEETAAYLHMSVSWVYQTLRRFCPARKIGRKVKYLKNDLDRYIEQSATLWSDLRVNKSLVAIEAEYGKAIRRKKR
jgi:predicted DNA-binding transcriptional regulator AlpA